MEKKFFFFDIDNTLLVWPKGVVPQSAIDCIGELKAAGHFVAIASGRLQVDAANYAKMVGMDDFVADGGYSITIDNKIVEMAGLDLDKCFAFLAHLEEKKIPWAICPYNEMVRYSPYEVMNEKLVDCDYYKSVVDKDFDYRSVKAIYKIYVNITEPEAVELGLDKWGLPHVAYGAHCLLYEPIDKAKGIKRVMDYYGAPYSSVVTFGDGRNDIPMFLPIWYNVAMGNGREQLKAVANYVTADADKDGILVACKAHGWIK